MPDWKDLFKDVVRAVQETTSPKECLVWSCDRSIREDHLFCYDHYQDFQYGLVDECPGCQRGKEAQYDVCLECHENPRPKAKRSASAREHPKYRWYKPEYSAAWERGDATADQFFVYILKLDGGKFYAGQTRELRERLSEHRDGRVQSTRGQRPKLVWFDTLPSRDAATEMEVELKTLIDANPREVRRMVIRFRDLVRELDYN